jgi:hypothetical protein
MEVVAAPRRSQALILFASTLWAILKPRRRYSFHPRASETPVGEAADEKYLRRGWMDSILVTGGP